MFDQIKATDLFSNWAKEGKDQRMANTHAPSVQEMLDHVLTSTTSPFSFIDAGCGNGWVVRKVLENDAEMYQQNEQINKKRIQSSRVLQKM